MNIQGNNYPFTDKPSNGLHDAYDIINEVDTDGNNALLQECYRVLNIPHVSIKERRDYESITILELIEQRCDATLKNYEGVSALNLIMEYNLLDDEQIISLFKKIPDNKFPRDIMHHVNSHKIGEYLYNRKIDVNALDEKSNSPLTSAIIRYLNFKKYDRDDIYFEEAKFLINELKTLIAFFCTIKADIDQGLPFHLLAEASNLSVFKILKNMKGNIDQTDSDGNTPLMIACEKESNSSYVSSLVKLGCNPFAKNRFGEMPIVSMVKDKLLDDDEILTLLQNSFQNDNEAFAKKFGCNKNTLLQTLSNILHYTQNKEIINFLIAQGISVDAFDKKGNTALFLAVEQLDTDLVELFLQHGANPMLEKPLNKNGKPLLCGASSPMMLIQNKIETCKQLYNNIDSKKIRKKGQSRELGLCLNIKALLLKHSDLITKLFYYPDIYPLIFDKQTLLKLTQISTGILSSILREEKAKITNSTINFLKFIENQDIFIPKELKQIDFTFCKYFFDVEAVVIRKIGQISHFLYKQNDLCILSLKDAEKKIPQPKEFSRIIDNLKPLSQIEKEIQSTQFCIIETINFLMSNGFFERAFALIKEKKLSCGKIEENELKNEFHNYTLINSPILTKTEKFIIIRDIFNNSVFPTFKFSIIRSKFKCYDAKAFRPCLEEKLMIKPKSDIISVFELAMMEFNTKGDIAKGAILKAVILKKELPNATAFEKAVVAWEDEKRADSNAIAETSVHLSKKNLEAAYLSVQQINDKNKKLNLIDIILNASIFCNEVKLVTKLAKLKKIISDSPDSINIQNLFIPSSHYSENSASLKSYENKNELMGAIRNALSTHDELDKIDCLIQILDYIREKAITNNHTDLALFAQKSKNCPTGINWNDLYRTLKKDDHYFNNDKSLIFFLSSHLLGKKPPINEKTASKNSEHLINPDYNEALTIAISYLFENDLLGAIKAAMKMSFGECKMDVVVRILDHINEKAIKNNDVNLAIYVERLKKSPMDIDWDELYFKLATQKKCDDPAEYYKLIKNKQKYSQIFESILSELLKGFDISKTLALIFCLQEQDDRRLALYRMAKNLSPNLSNFAPLDYAIMKIQNRSQMNNFLKALFTCIQDLIDCNISKAISTANEFGNKDQRKELFKYIFTDVDEESIKIVNEIDDIIDRRQYISDIFNQ